MMGVSGSEFDQCAAGRGRGVEGGEEVERSFGMLRLFGLFGLFGVWTRIDGRNLKCRLSND